MNNPGWIKFGLAIICGVLIPFALAPYDYSLIVIPAIIGIFRLVSIAANANQAFFLGGTFGLGLFGNGASWVYVSIHEYGPTPIPLALILTSLFVIILSLFFACQFYIYKRFFSQRISTDWLSFSAVWIIFEWLRSWFLTGFPWLYLGYAAIDSELENWAPMLGVYGLSFMLLLVSLSFYKLFSTKQKTYLLIPSILWSIGFGLSYYEWGETVSTEKVALVQGNIPQSTKWDPQLVSLSLSTYEKLSQPLWSQVDLIIWPESALPLLHVEVKPYLNNLKRQAYKNNTAVLIGLPFWQEATNGTDDKIYNSVLSYADTTNVYHKQKLVPFGEYVPLENLLRGAIQFFDLPMSAFTQGSSNQSPLFIKAKKVAPFICYEIVYPDFVANQAKQSQLIVTVSNDTWFGKSVGPHQHFQMARMRALENAKYILRSTNNGITAIINHRGKVVSQLPQFMRGVLIGSFQWRSATTWYAKFGSWPILIFCLLILLGFFRFNQSGT